MFWRAATCAGFRKVALFRAAYMWVFETRAHNLQLYANLDDWIGIGHEWSALSHMMDSTMKVCGWLGTTLNRNKSVKMIVHKAGIRPACGDHVLRDVRRVKSFKYLCVDVVSTSQAPRPTARRRAQDFITKCSFIPLVHFSQQSGLLADAMAGMWLPAGTRC